jgi:sodium transport system permease protein
MRAPDPRFVLLTLGKELRETLRDRRTLAVMVLVPLVVYPLLALIATQVLADRARGQEDRKSLVAVVGTGALADELRARIDARWVRFARKPALEGGAALEQDLEAGKLDGAVLVGPPGSDGRAPAEIVLDATRDDGRKADERLSELLEGMWPPGCAPRFDISRRNVAEKAQLGGYVLSQILPIMILLMVLLGAFYPAIDVTAGERERGTLETVLVAPIPRADLLLGKVLAVTILASASGFLNLGSMTLTLVQVLNMAASEQLPIPFARAAATGLVVLPTAFLLAAAFVAIGSLARGFKEAQNLLVPVYFVFFAPALLGALGDLRLSAGLALVPGLNVSLLARDIALGKASLGTSALVLLATLGWGLVALAAAARLYVSERFLAAGDDSGKRDKASGRGARTEPPTAGEALVLASVGYILLRLVWTPIMARDLIGGLLLSQWGGMAGLSVVFALATRRPLPRAFGVTRPRAQALVAAALIGLGGWLVANLISQWVLPPPKEYAEEFRRILFPETGGRGLFANLFLFALTPALCEELFFRGVIQRGLMTRSTPAVAIAFSALIFSLFHLDIYRFIPTGLLGLALGFAAYRGGSFLVSAVLHFLNNGILIVLGTYQLDRRIDALGGQAEVALLAMALALVFGGVFTFLRPPPDSGGPAPRM